MSEGQKSGAEHLETILKMLGLDSVSEAELPTGTLPLSRFGCQCRECRLKELALRKQEVEAK